MLAQIPSELRGQLKYIVTFFGVGLTYLTLAKFSLVLASINPSASPIWPPTGFALASVLLLEYSVWPAIFLGSFIANATTAGSIYTSLAIASGNTVECVIGAFLINRWSDGIKTFDTPAGVAKFALICFAPSTIISATIGVGSLSLAGYSEWANSLSVWLTWWMGDLAGALVITPVIVLWTTGSARSFNRQEWFHSSFVFVCAIVVGLVAFNPLLGQTANTGPLAFLAIAPLMWAALRRNQRDTATTALILACFAVWSALGGGGPFGRSTLNDSFLLLLAFVISISVPSLALSAEVAMRKSSRRAYRSDDARVVAPIKKSPYCCPGDSTPNCSPNSKFRRFRSRVCHAVGFICRNPRSLEQKRVAGSRYYLAGSKTFVTV